MVKLNEGYLKDYREFTTSKSKEAQQKIIDWFNRYEFGSIYHNIIKVLDGIEYDVDGIYMTKGDFVSVNYCKDGGEYKTWYLENVDTNLIFYLADELYSWNALELGEMAAVTGNVDTYLKVMFETNDEGYKDWHIEQLIEVEPDVVDDLAFQKYIIDKDVTNINILAKNGANFTEISKIKKYKDLIESEELGLL